MFDVLWHLIREVVPTSSNSIQIWVECAYSTIVVLVGFWIMANDTSLVLSGMLENDYIMEWTTHMGCVPKEITFVGR